jgi:hypothetical protein
MSKALNWASGTGILIGFGSFLRADYYTQPLRVLASKIPNSATGQTVELPLMRGQGSLYVTPQQWESVAPYWDTCMVIGGILFAALVVAFLHQAYTGFMRGYRSG